MNPVRIIVDSTADVSPAAAARLFTVPLTIHFGEEEFIPGVNMTNEEFYKKLTSGDIFPTTAQTPQNEIYDILKEESEKHETVIYFTISSKGSGQNFTATRIAEEIMEENPKADIRIVDTMRYSVYIASAAVYAVELIKEGIGADELIQKCEEYMQSWEAYLLVDTLKYLEKGGRINKTAAIVGTLLDIKPVLTVRDGLIESVEKLRGKKKVMKKLIELVKENPDFDEEKKEFIVIHSDENAGNELVEALKDEFDDIKLTMFSEFGPIVGTHTGPGCIAVLFRLKQK